MNSYFKMVDTFPFRPTDVETHSTTFGIILCTGRNCLGCNPENVGLQGGIEGFGVDQIYFEKDEKQEEDSKIKTWIMNPVRQLGAGDTAILYEEDRICNEESENLVQTGGYFASAISHSTSTNESFDDDTFGNDLDKSMERLPRYSDSQEQMIQREDGRLPRLSDPQVKIIQRDKEGLLRHSDSQEKEITEREIERLPKHSESQGQAVRREIETHPLEVLDSRVDTVDRSTRMLKSCTVHCLQFRRNVTSLDLKVTDIGYALEDQLGTTVNVLDIEKRSGGWRLWVKGENTRDELLRDGLLVGFRLHRLEEVEVAIPSHGNFFNDRNTQDSVP